MANTMWNETNPTALDVYERAFGIIANAHGGDWGLATPEWKQAAESFRDAYYTALRRRPLLAAGDDDTIHTDRAGNRFQCVWREWGWERINLPAEPESSRVR